MTQVRNRRPRDRRESLLALLIGGPAVILALGIVATEAWRWFQPNSSLFAVPAAASFADAIASDDVTRSVRDSFAPDRIQTRSSRSATRC